MLSSIRFYIYNEQIYSIYLLIINVKSIYYTYVEHICRIISVFRSFLFTFFMTNELNTLCEYNVRRLVGVFILHI